MDKHKQLLIESIRKEGRKSLFLHAVEPKGPEILIIGLFIPLCVYLLSITISTLLYNLKIDIHPFLLSFVIKKLTLVENVNLFICLFITWNLVFRFFLRYQGYLVNVSPSVEVSDIVRDILVAALGYILCFSVSDFRCWMTTLILLYLVASAEYHSASRRLQKTLEGTTNNDLLKNKIELNIAITKAKFRYDLYLFLFFVFLLINSFVFPSPIAHFIILCILFIFQVWYTKWGKPEKVGIRILEGKSGLSDILASSISCVFSPYVIPILMSIGTTYHSANTLYQAIQWMLIQVIFLSVIPFLIAILFKKIGLISDLHVNNRQQRFLFFLTLIPFWLICLFILKKISVPLFVFLLPLAYVLTVVVAMVINFVTKISAHSAAITGLWVGFLNVFGTYFFPFGILIPAVMWARVTRKKHSPSQTLLGMLVGGAIMMIVFMIFVY